MEQNHQFFRPILNTQKPEINKNIKLLKQILFSQIKKYRQSGQIKRKDELLFFLGQLNQSENYIEKYFNLDFIIKNVYKLEIEAENQNSNLQRIYDELLKLDLKMRMEDFAVKNPTKLEIILGNGVKEWNSNLEIKDIEN